MKTLIINAHPDFKNIAAHYSLRLQQYLEQQLQKDNQQYTILNLYDEWLPRLECDEDGLLTAWNDNNHHQEATKVRQRQEELLQQFLTYKRIVIVMPLLNFNITSRMKDYMDNILIARKTFQYVHNGSVPLLTDGRKVMFIQATGSIYTHDDRYAGLDFAVEYLKQMFTNIMGFDQFYLVRAQGTATSYWKQDSLVAVMKRLDQELVEFQK